MTRSIRTLGFIACAAGALAGAPAALAQGAAGSAQTPTVMPCDGVLQDRAACQREAGAAKQEARRNGLTSASPSAYDQNALARCELQPMAERAACEARVKGTGMSSTDGSVLGGGVIRETVTPIPAPAR
jgi:hypothetical protein